MSTAMVSAFYDVGDVLFQNKRNFLLQQQQQAAASSQHVSASRTMHTTSQPLTESRRIIGAQQQLSSLSQRIEAQRMVTKSPEPCQMSSQMQQNLVNMNLANNFSNLHTPTCIPGDVSPVFGMSDLHQFPQSREITGRRLDRTLSEPMMFQTDLPQSPGAGSLSDNQKPIAQSNMNPSRYKTESCRPFEENGHCKYGDKCQFAHGSHELRTLSRHPKYKTELCRTFHTIGFCPYGPRCHFIHNEDLRRLNMINQQKQQQAAASVSQQTSPVAGSVAASLPMMGQSAPSMISRPRALSFNLHSLAGHHHLSARDSLGSVADSPPSSVSVSPTMSPNFLDEYVMGSPNDVFTPPMASAPPGSVNNMFNFSNAEDFLLQRATQQAVQQQTLNQQAINMHAAQQKQSQAAEEAVALANLANSLHALSIQRARESGVTAPGMTLADLQAALVQPSAPSPPESISGDSGVSSTGVPSTTSSCGSPLEVSRNLRLPIFSQLSNRD